MTNLTNIEQNHADSVREALQKTKYRVMFATAGGDYFIHIAYAKTLDEAWHMGKLAVSLRTPFRAIDLIQIGHEVIEP